MLFFLSEETQVMAMQIDFSKWAQYNQAVLKNHFTTKNNRTTNSPRKLQQRRT